MQAMIRGKQGRHEVAEAREAEAAEAVQAAVPGLLEAGEEEEAATKVQAIIRGKQGRQEVEEAREAALAVVRGMLEAGEEEEESGEVGVQISLEEGGWVARVRPRPKTPPAGTVDASGDTSSTGASEGTDLYRVKISQVGGEHVARVSQPECILAYACQLCSSYCSPTSIAHSFSSCHPSQ